MRLPVKLAWNVTISVRVRMLPYNTAADATPLTTHWLFWIGLPAPFSTVLPA